MLHVPDIHRHLCLLLVFDKLNYVSGYGNTFCLIYLPTKLTALTLRFRFLMDVIDLTTISVIILQDGRKINVGDCALFKPPQDSPPFIGLIRQLTSNKDNILRVGVNWLYRPAELKLGKGTLLDGAPNEVFYSFHKDEIPAASLLHPCNVAFLPRGAELPTGTSSFVCRRVYDIENKCLWWLTDQDYINVSNQIFSFVCFNDEGMVE